MNDFFARIGLVLERLLENSSLNGDVKADGLRLARELQSAEVDFSALVEERVQAKADAFDGRLAAVEDDATKTRSALFDKTTIAALDAALEHRPEARAKLGEVFGGRPGANIHGIGPDTDTGPNPDYVPDPGEAMSIEVMPVGGGFNGAPAEAFDHDGKDGPGGSLAVARGETDPDKMTVPQLKEALDGLEVGYPADAKKAELQDLLRTAIGVAEIDVIEGAGDDTTSGA